MNFRNKATLHTRFPASRNDKLPCDVLFVARRASLLVLIWTASFHNNCSLEVMFDDPCNKAEAIYFASRQDSLHWFYSIEAVQRSTSTQK